MLSRNMNEGARALLVYRAALALRDTRRLCTRHLHSGAEAALAPAGRTRAVLLGE